MPVEIITEVMRPTAKIAARYFEKVILNDLVSVRTTSNFCHLAAPNKPAKIAVRILKMINEIMFTLNVWLTSITNFEVLTFNKTRHENIINDINTERKLYRWKFKRTKNPAKPVMK